MVQTDVLIVGAGPAGLALAIELGMRSVRVLVVERNERSGTAPRAKTTNVRTRTHLRRWGIADRLAAESPFGVDYPNNMVFVTRLGGYELARFPNAFNASPERDDRYPEHGQWIPQYRLEKVLLEKARSLSNVNIRFNTRLTAAEQDSETVSAVITGRDGAGERVTSRYLVGADGARSSVRDLIGARMEGRPALSHHYNIIFRAPGLAQAHRHGPAAIYWQIGKDGFSAIGPMDTGDRWFFAPGGAKPGQALSALEAVQLIKDRTSIDLPFEILSADTWTASELIADAYSKGRMFLAGDACHLHPPAGGYGMNMGIGDAVDLGWKIAATLQGWGGPALLENYQTERRSVAKTVIEESMANFAIYNALPPAAIEDGSAAGEATRAKIGAQIQATKAREFFTLGTVLGLCYHSPLLSPEGDSEPEFDSQVYKPSARPGCLAPHAWLPDGRSLYDLFGSGFTLVASGEAKESDLRRAQNEAGSLGAPLTIVKPEGVDVAGLYEAPLTLVRPDQHVAWRGHSWPDWVLPTASGHGKQVGEG